MEQNSFHFLWISVMFWGAGCSGPLESRMIYFPDGPLRATPSDAGLAYEDLFLETRDGVRIHAWFVPKAKARGTMLWFHGNAGNMGDRVAQIKTYHDRWSVSQILIDYRGYGKSGGQISEEGTYEDGRAAMSYLLKEKGISPGALILFGRSLGAAVAVQMATEFDAAGLILETPFTSIRDMARRHYPLIGSAYPLRIRYASIDKISRVTMPLLILHGDRDNIVPFEQAERLFEAANEPKRFFRIAGAGHNDILLTADNSYHLEVGRFIAEVVKEEE